VAPKPLAISFACIWRTFVRKESLSADRRRRAFVSSRAGLERAKFPNSIVSVSSTAVHGIPLVLEPIILARIAVARLGLVGKGNELIEDRHKKSSTASLRRSKRTQRALGDLAVDAGSGQGGPGENGLQANDTVWRGHGCAASCRVFLTTPEP